MTERCPNPLYFLRDDVCDYMDDIGKECNCASIVMYVLESERGTSDFSPEHLLCIGAGQSYPEIELVDLLKIPHSNVALLDKHFRTKARERLDSVAPDIMRIEQEMFSYLQNPDRSFSLITTFGLDYLLVGEFLNEFLGLVPNVLSDQGIVFVQSLEAPRKKSRDFALKHDLSQLNSNPYFFKKNR